MRAVAVLLPLLLFTAAAASAPEGENPLGESCSAATGAEFMACLNATQPCASEAGVFIHLEGAEGSWAARAAQSHSAPAS